jgi:hypothetical protein
MELFALPFSHYPIVVAVCFRSRGCIQQFVNRLTTFSAPPGPLYEGLFLLQREQQVPAQLTGPHFIWGAGKMRLWIYIAA